jgi:hypothetical protein
MRPGPTPPPAPDPRAILEQALATEGLSLRVLAERLMGRDERTVRRWRAGDIAVPPHAAAWLAWFAELGVAARRRLLALHNI